MLSSKLNSIPFMGRPDIFLSENKTQRQIPPLLTVPENLKNKLQEQDHELDHKIQDIDLKLKTTTTSSLKVKINLEEKQQQGDKLEEEGLKTPTSPENKIPVIFTCPPAPRKPKSVPCLSKRKSLSFRVFLDCSKEIESLFPPPAAVVFEDLGGGGGGKMKKFRSKSFSSITN